MDTLSLPTQASSIKKGDHVLLRDHPCKVIYFSIFKNGKHGGAKIHFVGTDIFTKKKYEEMFSTTDNAQVPIITRTEYLLLDISDDDFCSCLPISNAASSGETKEDLKLPENLRRNIAEAFEQEKQVILTVVSSMGSECIFSFRVDSLNK